jgi:hypothetical protein
MVLKENEIEVEDVESQQIEHIRREQQNTVEQHNRAQELNVLRKRRIRIWVGGSIFIVTLTSVICLLVL